MNELHCGLKRNLPIPKSGLVIVDEVPDIPQSRIFDPLRHSFNPLRNISYKKARSIADVLYTISPQGENTLTVRNGRRSLLRALLSAKRLDEINSDDDEVRGMIDDLLISPVLRQVLCGRYNRFSFNRRSLIFARISRRELGEFDALVLGLFLGVIATFAPLWCT